ncbi:MAG: PKD domain-containing protein [Lentimicrobiaceae bacterium]|nr:PKD domain-containing protein [Lentimicrobiaceae bacterium]
MKNVSFFSSKVIFDAHNLVSLPKQRRRLSAFIRVCAVFAGLFFACLQFAKAQTIDTLIWTWEREANDVINFCVYVPVNEAFTVDWGDGSTEIIVPNNHTYWPWHLYLVSGTYTVTVVGSSTCNFERIYLYSAVPPSSVTYIKSKCKYLALVSCSSTITNSFRQLSKVRSVDITAADNPNLTDLSLDYNQLTLTQCDSIEKSVGKHKLLYTLSPQYLEPRTIICDTIDFSTETTFINWFDNKTYSTVFEVYKKDPLYPCNGYEQAVLWGWCAPADPSDYTETNGIFLFYNPGDYMIKMTNQAVSGFHGDGWYPVAVYQAVTVLPGGFETTKINAIICQGSTYTLNGFNESQAGIYYQTLPNINGCDSVVELTLTVSDILTDTLNVTICQGDTFYYNGQAVSPAEPFSTFNFPFSTSDGCDSLVILNITANPTDKAVFSDTICKGETYRFFGQNLTDSGTYTHIMTNHHGCNIVIELELNVSPMKIVPITASICQDSFYYFAGKNLTTAGTYRDTIQAFCGCDSIVELTLSINSSVAEFEADPQTASLGEEIKFTDKSTQSNGKTTSWYWNFGDLQNSSVQNPTHRYATSGSFTVLLKIEDENGCRDSVEHEISIIASNLYFPNIFTPVGNDGTKYVFRPLEDAGYFEEFQIDIYDRWGNSVWKNACTGSNCPSYDNSFWWDGTNKFGNQVSDGVYYWVVYASAAPAAQPIVKNGSVTVVR